MTSKAAYNIIKNQEKISYSMKHITIRININIGRKISVIKPCSTKAMPMIDAA
mgnify:CR=1 FL=1